MSSAPPTTMTAAVPALPLLQRTVPRGALAQLAQTMLQRTMFCDPAHSVRNLRHTEVGPEASRDDKEDQFSASFIGQSFRPGTAITRGIKYYGRKYQSATGLEVLNLHGNSGKNQDDSNITLLLSEMRKNPKAIVGGDINFSFDVDPATGRLTPKAKALLTKILAANPALTSKYDIVICSNVVDRERKGDEHCRFNAQGFYKTERTVKETMIAFVPKALGLDKRRLAGVHLITPATDLSSLRFGIVHAFSETLAQDHNRLVIRIRAHGGAVLAFSNRTSVHTFKGFGKTMYRQEAPQPLHTAFVKTLHGLLAKAATAIYSDCATIALERARIAVKTRLEEERAAAANEKRARREEDDKIVIDLEPLIEAELEAHPSVAFGKLTLAEKQAILRDRGALSDRKIFPKDSIYAGDVKSWAAIAKRIDALVEALIASEPAKKLSRYLITPLAASKAKLKTAIMKGVQKKNNLQYVSNKVLNLVVSANIAGLANITLPPGATAYSVEREQDRQVLADLLGKAEEGDTLAEFACEHVPPAAA